MFIRILTPVNDVYEQRYAINSAEKNTWEGGGGGGGVIGGGD